MKVTAHTILSVPQKGLDHLAFKVDDLDKALDEGGLAGHLTILDVRMRNSRWTYVDDSNGVWINLLVAHGW